MNEKQRRHVSTIGNIIAYTARTAGYQLFISIPLLRLQSDVTASADGALPTPDEANAAPTSRASPLSPLFLAATAPAPEVVPDADPAKPPSNEVEGVIASTGQQSSSPSSGSGHTHSALDALLAACELAAEQDSAAPKDGHETAATMGSSGGASEGGDAGGSILATALAPERRSYPGCTTPSKALDEQRREVGMAIVPYTQGVGEAGARQQPQPAATLPEEPAGSSEGGGVVVCGRTVGGGEVGVSPAPRTAAGGAACNGSGGGGGETVACSSYLNSNAFKFRRHKSKVRGSVVISWNQLLRQQVSHPICRNIQGDHKHQPV